jgi:hypothetical protein
MAATGRANQEESSVMTKAVLEPTIEWRTEDIWKALTDLQRVEMVETLERLAEERLGEIVPQGGSIPKGWHIQNYLCKGGAGPLHGYIACVKERNGG